MPIQVLLVDDSPVVLMILKRLLDSTPDIEVAGTARNAREALALIPKMHPQVICTDLKMPEMDGIEFIREVMANFPRPILVLSAEVQTQDTQNVFRLLEAGAVDVLPKPMSGVTADLIAIKKELISKIKVLAGVTVFALHRRQTHITRNRLPLEQNYLNFTDLSDSFAPRAAIENADFPSLPIDIVGIGASTGGPQALRSILSQLP
ncbi:MAG: response regulator, partial [Geitlerinemataceae cyanobacterium]